MIELSAYLHDLGKLAIPSEILEKPGRLTAKEWDVMRTHVYYTYQILSPVKALGALRSLHPERASTEAATPSATPPIIHPSDDDTT